MAVFTSRYSNPALAGGERRAVRISMGTPRFRLGYRLDADIPELMPFGLRGRAFDSFMAGYVERLEKAGAARIGAILERMQQGGRDAVLLCYEDIRKPGAWCHRTMFADWWRERTGETIAELPHPDAKGASKPTKAPAGGGIMPSIQLTLFG